MPAESVACQSFDDFVARVRSERFASARLFRGHASANWRLSSIWERWLQNRFPWGKPESYPSVFGGRMEMIAFRAVQLEAFKRAASQLGSLQENLLADDRAIWVLGRHHGLTTPLLDWTSSPFIAVFFAFFARLESSADHFRYGPGVSDKPPWGITSDPVAIWELYHAPDLEQPGELEIFSVDRIYSERQRAQQGLFTLLTHERHLDLESYLQERGLCHLLRRYDLPGTAFVETLVTLRQTGITYGRLFPDLDGAAVEANLSSYMLSLGTMAGVNVSADG